MSLTTTVWCNCYHQQVFLTLCYGWHLPSLSLESTSHPSPKEENEKPTSPASATPVEPEAKSSDAPQGDKEAAFNFTDMLSTSKPTSSTTSDHALSSCTYSRLYRHVTLVGGLRAGIFTRLAENTDMDECARKCCARRSCDAAIHMRATCFGLQCSSSKLCSTRPSRLKNFSLHIMYMYRGESNGESRINVL